MSYRNKPRVNISYVRETKNDDVREERTVIKQSGKRTSNILIGDYEKNYDKFFAKFDGKTRRKRSDSTTKSMTSYNVYAQTGFDKWFNILLCRYIVCRAGFYT